jgi:homoserine kinase type II
MAVLTRLDRREAEALVAAYGLGELGSIEGIPAGSVNSNYALDVGGRRLFLRIYEEQDIEGARGETGMLVRLARAGVQTPSPLQRLDGARVSVVGGKPAAIFPWVEGSMICQAGVTADRARAVGRALARMHLAAAGEVRGPGRFRLEDLAARLDGIEASRDAEFAARVPALRAALAWAEAERDASLPAGVVHGDLFRDNVLWDDRGAIAALLDFESAFDGKYTFDLMVTVLSWCFGDGLQQGLARAMCAGYLEVRSLGEAERAGLWAEGCFAAMRFTVTRITDYAMRTGASGPRVVKDWRRFQRRFDDLRTLGRDGLRATLGV